MFKYIDVFKDYCVRPQTILRWRQICILDHDLLVKGLRIVSTFSKPSIAETLEVNPGNAINRKFSISILNVVILINTSIDIYN